MALNIGIKNSILTGNAISINFRYWFFTLLSHIFIHSSTVFKEALFLVFLIGWGCVCRCLERTLRLTLELNAKDLADGLGVSRTIVTCV